eukprot:2805992-Pleurochrysis_carterae.AAC.1
MSETRGRAERARPLVPCAPARTSRKRARTLQSRACVEKRARARERAWRHPPSWLIVGDLKLCCGGGLRQGARKRLRTRVERVRASKRARGISAVQSTSGGWYDSTSARARAGKANPPACK